MQRESVMAVLIKTKHFICIMVFIIFYVLFNSNGFNEEEIGVMIFLKIALIWFRILNKQISRKKISPKIISGRRLLVENYNER